LVLLIRFIDERLEVRQGVVPKLVELAPQGSESVTASCVDAAVAVAAIAHETRVLEDLQVLGNGRPAHRELESDLPDGARSSGDPSEDGAPGWIAECRPRVNYVSSH
jgi:hypothetical protein